MTVIRDPSTQKGGQVNAEGQLVVRSIVESEIEHASGVLGTAYSWDSTELDIDVNGTMLFVKSTSNIPLILDRLILNGSNVICTWDINIGTATTTPSGTTVTGQNLATKTFNSPADATALSNETAVVDGTTVMRIKTGISETKIVDLSGIIVSKGHYIQTNQKTESTSGSAILIGHFEDPS